MKKLLLVSLAAIGCGCTSTRVLDATVMSTKNIDIKKSLHRVDEGVRATGSDTVSMYVLALQAHQLPSMKEAMDRAIEQYPGCVGLSNVAVNYEEKLFPFVFHERVYTVEGNPIYEVAK